MNTPFLCASMAPPPVLGVAALTTAAMQGTPLEVLAAQIEQAARGASARLYDHGILQQLALSRETGLALQADALQASLLFRVDAPRPAPPAGTRPLRLLALAAPGDLMMNTPLDFITNNLDVQLDVLFVVPGRPLPDAIPDHDLMFVAVSEADAPMLARLRALCAAWPRPVLNEPGSLPILARDRLWQALADAPGLLSPATIRIGRQALAAIAVDGAPLHRDLPRLPWLVRPVGSHAGIGLKKIESRDGLAAAIEASGAQEFYVCGYIDYRSTDGFFRKYRIVFFGGRPFLCHMAVSAHWMVHYLNAGMTNSDHKRADEAQAMATFETGFALRHRGAFQALCRALPFDVFSIDCAELPDGRLLVFEADTAAIIHAMDPIDLFPYKHVQMRQVFDAFGAFLRNKAGHQPAAPL